jgi:hypothetical protein
MQQICFRLSDELIRELDAYALSRGGRSSALREMARRAVEGDGGSLAETVIKTAHNITPSVKLDFSKEEISLLAAEALAAGMSTREWIKAAALRTVSPARHFNKYDRTGFGRLVREVREIKISLTRSLRRLEQRALDQPGEVKQLNLLQAVALRLERIELGIVYGMKGNDRYWEQLEQGSVRPIRNDVAA